VILEVLRFRIIRMSNALGRLAEVEKCMARLDVGSEHVSQCRPSRNKLFPQAISIAVCL
jgi:hypothetical protein